MNNKPFYKSMTFYGCLGIFVGGGLEALGSGGAIATTLQLAGIPVAGYGIRRALD